MSTHPYHLESAIFGQISAKFSGIVKVISEKVINCIQTTLFDFFTPHNKTIAYTNQMLSNHKIAMICKGGN